MRLAEIYAVPAADLLPLDPSEQGVMIDLDMAAESKEGDLIDRYLAAIHFLRREGRPDEVRDSDKAVIASLLDSTVESVPGQD